MDVPPKWHILHRDTVALEVGGSGVISAQTMGSTPWGLSIWSMGRMKKNIAAVALGMMTWASAAQAADAALGQPVDRQLSWQEPGNLLGKTAISFHDGLIMPIIVGITIFVTLLLVYTLWRFRASANPVPSKTTHGLAVEIAWTVIPVLILVVMAFPSMRLLYAQHKIPAKADVVLKITGKQWYWTYEYVDEKIGFDANMLKQAELKPGQPNLLATDNAVVVPVNKVVKLLVTGEDVIHAWWIPSLFLQQDAVPGRVVETWFKAEKTGVYYGQCNQICGINHGYMPIEVHVVSDADYAAWLATAKTKFALNDNGTRGASQMAAAATATVQN
jgi:cytochrome c oxidase subunit II